MLLTNRRLKINDLTLFGGGIHHPRAQGQSAGSYTTKSFEEILQQKAQIPLQKQGKYGILILKMVVPLEEPFPEDPQRPEGK